MRVTWSQLWGHLGLTSAFECDFGFTLASLWLQFLHIRVTLGSLLGHVGGSDFGYMVVTLVYYGSTMGRLWRRFGYMKVRLQKTFIFPLDFNDFINLWGARTNVT